MKVKMGNYMFELMTPNATKVMIKEVSMNSFQDIWKELNKLRTDIMKLREEFIVEGKWIKKNLK